MVERNEPELELERDLRLAHLKMEHSTLLRCLNQRRGHCQPQADGVVLHALHMELQSGEHRHCCERRQALTICQGLHAARD
ncbi:hypothetical protein [Caldimonas tepidiphila]|uniref:hypothetical protein n=1 Tax=Caldimonas tepidiphila TaxID=2315841 RepID=UPI000E5B1D27|nr:hypothetical protein [Caldimonas tepidiphila]